MITDGEATDGGAQLLVDLSGRIAFGQVDYLILGKDLYYAWA